MGHRCRRAGTERVERAEHDANAARSFGQLFDAITSNVAQVLHGKIDAIELAVMCLLAEGHLLVEDVPGVGKTSLAKALAASIDCSWKRVQFTPDLLPTDLVGVSVYQRSTETFRFEPGPLFANIVLADEINRASPKTQSALLEAMEERQITADGVSRRLDAPFMVIATQNPVDQEGTYRLPESQLDRFLLPDRDRLPGSRRRDRDARRPGFAAALRRLVPVVSIDEIRGMIDSVNADLRRQRAQVVPRRPRRGEPSPSGHRTRVVTARHVAVGGRRTRPRRGQGPQLRDAGRRQGRRRRHPQPPHHDARRPGAHLSPADAISEVFEAVPVPIAH